MTDTAPHRTRLVVLPEYADERIDRYLAAVTALSRRRLRGLMAEGVVRLNGRAQRVQSRGVAVGDVIDISLPAEELQVPPAPVIPAVTVLHDDGWLLAVDKPAGILSQPAERRAPGELAMDEMALLHCALQEGKRPFLRLIHRLDRVTSGVLLFARDPRVLKPLAEAWREGRAERRYLALVVGHPDFEAREVTAPLGRDPSGGWRFQVLDESAGGRPARTTVTVQERRAGTTLVECLLSTGRTHQVRVHLAHLGHPVVGDTLYGAAPGLASRPLLHAVELSVPHPRSGEMVCLRAELPPEFAPAPSA